MTQKSLEHTKNYQLIARNVFLSQEFFKIYNFLAEKGVELVPLKGISLLQRVYRFDERYIGDIDVLVKEENLSKAIGLLKESGYFHHRPFFNSKKPYSIYLNSFPLYKKSKLPFSIHLHWHLSNSTYPLFMHNINMDDVWNNIKLESYQENKILVFEPNYEVVYLCLHTFKHSFNKLSLFIDIEKVIERYLEKIDW